MIFMFEKFFNALQTFDCELTLCSGENIPEKIFPPLVHLLFMISHSSFKFLVDWVEIWSFPRICLRYFFNKQGLSALMLYLPTQTTWNFILMGILPRCEDIERRLAICVCFDKLQKEQNWTFSQQLCITEWVYVTKQHKTMSLLMNSSLSHCSRRCQSWIHNFCCVKTSAN